MSGSGHDVCERLPSGSASADRADDAWLYLPSTRRRPQHRRPCSRPPGQPSQLAHGGLPDSGGGAISIGDEAADEGHMRKTVIIAIAAAAALTAGCSSNTAVDDAAAAPTTDALAA